MNQPPRRPISLPRLHEMHASGEPIAMMTCYDASFARALHQAGIDCLLVGDSLGMVLQGHDTTLPVTLEQMAYHLACVTRGAPQAWRIADLPYGSYQSSPEQALRSACELTRAGAQMVKLEGGGWTVDTARFLSERGIPVCGHLGLTPQTVHALGGWRVQGRGEQGADLLQQAHELRDAGAAMLVLELVPSDLAGKITESLGFPVIGIGAGPRCSGQVLVLHDALGLSPGRAPRFVRNFMEGAGSIDAALRAYVRAVKQREFPEYGLHTY